MYLYLVSLIEYLDKIKTRAEKKDDFWNKLKENKTKVNSYTIHENNLLIDMPDTIQRNSFIKRYKKMNESFDYYSDDIPEDYKKLYGNNIDYKCGGSGHLKPICKSLGPILSEKQMF